MRSRQEQRRDPSPRATGLSTRRPTAMLVAALAALAAGFAVLLGPATPAYAHAAVVSTTPQQQSVLGSSPRVVTVTFSEPINPVPGRVQVVAPDGARISSGEPTVRGSTLRIPLRIAAHPLGTYLVSYRVISADNHPVAGGYTFAVGAPSATAPTPPRETVRASVRIAMPLATYVGYVGLVLLIGPTLLLGLLWPHRLSRRGPVRLVGLGLGLVGLSTVAALWLQAPYAAGTSIVDVSVTDLRQVLDSDFGRMLLLRLGLLLLVAALLRPVLRGRGGRPRAVLLILLGLAGLATWPLAGHAVASPVPLASAISGVAHLAAMASWLGGLLTLLGFLLPNAHPRVLAVILPAWSRWATIAVIWLVAGGLGQLLVEFGTVGALVGTAYGRLVLTKAALLVAVLAAAAYARRMVRRRAAKTDPEPSSATPHRTEPDRHPVSVGVGGVGLAPERVRTGVATLERGPVRTGEGVADDRRRLRRMVGLEIAGTALILALSSVLVQTTPARNADVEAAAAASDSFAQTLTCPLYTLQFDIYPVQLGEDNTVHAYLYNADGKPLPAAEWTLTTALPAKGVEPVSTPLLGLTANHALGAVTFPIPGDWQLRFTIRTTEIDQATVTTTVRVR